MSNRFSLSMNRHPNHFRASRKSSRTPFSFAHGRFELLFEGELFPQGKKCVIHPEPYVASLFLAYGTHAFNMLRGQFSLVIWDDQDQVLYGVRDPFGMYPLYYKEELTCFQVGTNKQALVSEIFGYTPNEETLQQFFSFQYAPDPLTMSEGIFSLEAGHYFKKEIDQKMEIYRYFHAELRPNQQIDEQKMVENIQAALASAVYSRIPEQASVGIFLSGGIDSSVIAALAKKSRSDVKAFSVDFAEEGYSEVAHAKRTADELGIELITHTITVDEFIDVTEHVVSTMQDPIADPSCIPLYIAAREAKKQVDVILSGEGADELFGGYGIYREYESIKFLSHLPNPILRSIRYIAAAIPEGFKGRSYLLRASTPLHKRYIGNAKIFEEDAKEDFLKSFDDKRTYEQRMRPFFEHVQHAHPMEQMQYVDLHTWLPGNILAKARTMARAHELDVRMPFLDADVFAVAKQIPVDLKIRNQTTKYILREAAKGIAPDHVINQKKLGFPVPIRNWLKNELHDWAISIIKRAPTDHLIDRAYVLDLVEKHALDRKDYSRKIWTILIFMMWYEHQVAKTDNEEEQLYGT